MKTRFKNDEDALWEMIHEAQKEFFKAGFYIDYWGKQVESPQVAGLVECQKHVEEFKSWQNQQEDKIKQLLDYGKRQGLC